MIISKNMHTFVLQKRLPSIFILLSRIGCLPSWCSLIAKKSVINNVLKYIKLIFNESKNKNGGWLMKKNIYNSLKMMWNMGWTKRPHSEV
jgi:hypothetical protein